MVNYFYSDTNGNRRGPFNVEQIIQLARYNHIAPTTLLETDDGSKMHADEVPDVKFNSGTNAARQWQFNFTTHLFLCQFCCGAVWVAAIALGLVATFWAIVSTHLLGLANFAHFNKTGFT